MDVNKIIQLEKKYQEKIWDIQNSSEFQEALFNAHDTLKNNFDYIYENFDDKNIIKVAIERIIRYFGYKDLKATGIYPSPLSSDMAIETNDSIICIDAKTINMITNEGDDKSIHFGRNQITFDNISKYSTKEGSLNFKGVTFKPHLKHIHNGKPVLTFFITVNYEDDHIRSNSFKLKKQSLVSVPNYVIAKNDFKNDLITNYKTYSYVNKALAERFGSQYKPLNRKKTSWTEFKINQSKAYYDSSLPHPEDSTSKCVWKKIDKSYKVLRVDAGSARIDKDFLKKHNRVEEKNLI